MDTKVCGECGDELVRTVTEAKDKYCIELKQYCHDKDVYLLCKNEKCVRNTRPIMVSSTRTYETKRRCG